MIGRKKTDFSLTAMTILVCFAPVGVCSKKVTGMKKMIKRVDTNMLKV